VQIGCFEPACGEQIIRTGTTPTGGREGFLGGSQSLGRRIITAVSFISSDGLQAERRYVSAVPHCAAPKVEPDNSPVRKGQRAEVPPTIGTIPGGISHDPSKAFHLAFPASVKNLPATSHAEGTPPQNPRPAGVRPVQMQDLHSCGNNCLPIFK